MIWKTPSLVMDTVGRCRKIFDVGVCIFIPSRRRQTPPVQTLTAHQKQIEAKTWSIERIDLGSKTKF